MPEAGVVVQEGTEGVDEGGSVEEVGEEGLLLVGDREEDSVEVEEGDEAVVDGLLVLVEVEGGGFKYCITSIVISSATLLINWYPHPELNRYRYAHLFASRTGLSFSST